MSVEESPFATVLLIAIVAVAASAEKFASSNDASIVQSNLWALLVAGSKGYENYRHQADICHAYHVLRNHGVLEQNIVVMMYDDIASNNANPTPGIIVNYPNGTDVYHGVRLDYTRELVTPQNFLDILQGNIVSGGSGKVIASGPNDHVFVNFVGLGGFGVLSFPDGQLHARNFARIIYEMEMKKMFSKMVIYVDADYSGSMFQSILIDNKNVYATTSAGPYEPSYSCYPDSFRKTYLGDAYSVRWMEYSDRVDLRKKTLSDQFNFVKQKTTNSNVMEYGNWRMGALFLSEFQGAHDTKPIVVPERLCHPVNSRDVPIQIVRHELQRASSPEAVLPIFYKLRAIHRKRTYLDNKVHEIATIISKSNEEITKALLAKNQPLNNFACFEHIVENFNNRCFSLSENPYALGSLRVLANMCEGDFGAENIIDAMSTACRFIDAKNIV